MNIDVSMVEEIGIEIATTEEALWKRVQEQTEEIIGKLEDDLIVNKALLRLAKKKTKGITKI